MSCLNNEMLLETLFEEALEELTRQGFDKMFNQVNLERIATNLAKQMLRRGVNPSLFFIILL